MPGSRQPPAHSAGGGPEETPQERPEGPPEEAPTAAPAREAHIAGVRRAEIVGFSELLVRLILASRAVERARPRSGPDLSPHAVRATMHLIQHGRGTVGELADGLGVSMGWASRIADELERAGHVLRERDALDRRVVRLRLSPAAERVAEQMYSERGRVVAEALAALTDAERAVVARFLGRLTAGLEALVEPAPDPPDHPAADPPPGAD